MDIHTSSLTPEHCRLWCLQLLLQCTLMAVATTRAMAGDPMSDTFQPDAFGTRAALRQRTAGLEDPFTRECSIATPPEPLSLAAAVDVALCRNPTTRTAWAAAHQQAAALGAAESAWLPTLSASVSQTGVHGPHIDATGTSVTESQHTNDAAVDLSWTLYDFGGRTSRIASARYLLDAAAASTSRAVQQTVFSAVQGFYGLVAGDAAVVAAKSAEEAASRSVTITKALYEGGAAALGDVLQAQTAYDQAVLTRIQAEQADKTALAALAVAMGLQADRPLKVRGEVVPADAPALAPRLAALMTQAMQQRPDLAAALAQRDSAVADVTVARAGGRPTITVAANHSRIDTTALPVQNFNQIGVTVTVPLFNGFNTTYTVRQAQAALETREVNVDQVRLTVSQDVWNGYYGLNSAGEQLGATATLVSTALQNQDVALGRYQAGLGTILDLLTAQAAAAAAQQTRITAELNWQVARAQLVLALGRLSGVEPLQPGAVVP